MESIEPLWQVIKEQVSYDEPDLGWFTQKKLPKMGAGSNIIKL